jgi:4-hydroxyphenylacetate 3-monooxygenase
VRGAKMHTSCAPYVDNLIVLPSRTMQEGDESYSVAFQIPVDTDGLTLYTSDFLEGGQHAWTHPVSAKHKMLETLTIFDDVFVPWEEVFIYKNRELTAGQFSVTAAHVLGNTQSHIRSLSKLQFLVGLVKRCMDLSGRSANPETVAQLGDLATRVSVVEGMILGAEAAAEPDQFAVMRPKDALLYASQVFQQAMYPPLLNQIRQLMGGSLIQLPAAVGELQAPESLADMERYVRWPRAGGRERVKLLKLLWDALGSEFGSRHLQYEMFYAGEPGAIQGREFRSFNWAAVEALVDRCLASYDETTI